ncbi:MAG: 4-(cytidine 5'-diphospho)-2-C-methyl-D-erythritol kinase, partial [Mariprofundaceae bacterium]
MNIPLTLPAPAKINLHLHIRSVMENGLHELDTSFAFTEAHDLLHFSPANSIEVSCSEAHLGGERNLVHRVLTALQQQRQVKQGLRVHIDKQLPEQAGLGGGSSDAATALMYANKAWGCKLSQAQLIDFSAPFGADIPCFLYGRASLASGIGEKLVDYPEALPEQALLLAWPGSGLSTAAVFRHFDEHMTAPSASGPETSRPTVALTGSGGLD